MPDRLKKVATGPLLLGVVLIVVALAVLLDLAIDVPWTALLEVVLVAVGATLIWASRTRPNNRDIFAVGLVLAVALTAAWWAGAGFEGGVGIRTEEPATADELKPYEMAVGSLTVDLSAVQPPPPGLEIEAEVAVGRLVIIVPPGVVIVGPEGEDGNPPRGARTGVGYLETPVSDDLGIGSELGLGLPGVATTTPRFIIDASVGVGNLQIRTPEVEEPDEE
ncbi:hypothetical protein BH24ACT3_BH24ACT3_06200 [soil metagenome]